MTHKYKLTFIAALALASSLLPLFAGVSLAAQKPRHSLSARAKFKHHRLVIAPTARMNGALFDSAITAQDAWTPGQNFPYPDRPYGDPDHW